MSRTTAPAAVLLSLLFTFGSPDPSRSAEPGESAPERMERVKSLQREQLTRKARRRISEARDFLAGIRAEPLPSRRAEKTQAVADAIGTSRVAPGRAGRDWILGGAAIAPNVRVNDPAGDDSFASQNEPSVAAHGDNVLAVWNDWPGGTFTGSLQGYAYSTNGGAAFTDPGEIPSPFETFWLSDPVVTVNEKTGEFYYCGLIEATDPETELSSNGLGVARGTFSGGTFGWDVARVIRMEPDDEHFIDKCWIVADSATGNLYVTYTDFTLTSNSIAFQRSLDGGVTWGPVITLSSAAGAGLVQGSRVAVGPQGEVYAVWKELGPSVPGFDYMRFRTSTNQGATFGSEQMAATFYDNFGTGAPGFNRERGIGFPAIAVDRTTGPHRGRVYVAWNESLNWFDDIPVLGGMLTETESNDALANANPFTPGQTLSGSFGHTLDLDAFRFSAVQGRTYVFWSDNVPVSLYRMRIFCTDTVTSLAFTGRLDPPLDSQGNQSIMVWTAPTSGTYYLDMGYVDRSAATPGPYRIRTGVTNPGPGDRGRDQRDVFVTSSSGGVGWTNPSLVNEDAPYYDNWLPEVTVSGFGAIHAIWYDWRDSPATCAGMSHVYMARSEDGGSAWTTLGRLTDAPSDWSQVRSNLVPNQGDYLGFYANDQAVYSCWTDGRNGTPDIYSAVVVATPESLQVAVSARPEPSRLTIFWQFRVGRIVDATVYREQGGVRTSLGAVQSDAAGTISYVDVAVERGVLYRYSLGVQVGGSEVIVGVIRVTVPVGPILAQPNPLSTSTRLTYDVPGTGGDVELMVYDLQGRLIRVLRREFQFPGTYSVVWDGTDDGGRVVRAGIYLVRLVHPGGSTSRRVSLVP